MSGNSTAVRLARREELPAVMNVLDGAMLSVDADAVAGKLDGNMLVAVEGDRVLGACVLNPRAGGAHVEAVAVRPGRRGQGIGSALVEAAADRKGGLTAEFDADRREFYESLGFGVEVVGEGRYRGRRE